MNGRIRLGKMIKDETAVTPVTDSQTTVSELKELIRKFVEDQGWQNFDLPHHLAKSIIIEAAELLEHYQWQDKIENQEEVEHELADVLIYCFQLAMAYQIDVVDIIQHKLELNKQKK